LFTQHVSSITHYSQHILLSHKIQILQQHSRLKGMPTWMLHPISSALQYQVWMSKNLYNHLLRWLYAYI